MIVIRAADAAAFPTPNGNRSTPVATPSLGARDVTIVHQRQEPGGFNPLHRQTREEVMVLLRGRVLVTVDGERTELAPHDALVLPADTPHRVDNPGPDEAEWLIVSAAGMAFLHEDGRPASPPWIA